MKLRMTEQEKQERERKLTRELDALAQRLDALARRKGLGSEEVAAALLKDASMKPARRSHLCPKIREVLLTCSATRRVFRILESVKLTGHGFTRAKVGESLMEIGLYGFLLGLVLTLYVGAGVLESAIMFGSLSILCLGGVVLGW